MGTRVREAGADHRLRRPVGPSALCLRGPSPSAAGSPLVGSAAHGHAAQGSPRPPGAAAWTWSAPEDVLVLGPHRVSLQQQRLVSSCRSSQAWVWPSGDAASVQWAPRLRPGSG